MAGLAAIPLGLAELGAVVGESSWEWTALFAPVLWSGIWTNFLSTGLTKAGHAVLGPHQGRSIEDGLPTFFNVFNADNLTLADMRVLHGMVAQPVGE